MFRPGLVSVTFRHLDPAGIIALTQKAELEGLMWGSDVHVPVGDLAQAREVGRQTREAGLAIESYGSYYRAGSETSEQPYELILETAVALGAPRIRVWAGGTESAKTSAAERSAISQDLRRCAELANQAGVAIALEFHSHTLTDSAASAGALMTDLEGSGVRLYWQPPNGMPPAAAIAGLRQISPWVDHVHVFHWLIKGEEQIRLPLTDAAEVWPRYLEALAETPRERWAMLEFVKGDDPAQLIRDASQLREWLKRLDSSDPSP